MLPKKVCTHFFAIVDLTFLSRMPPKITSEDQSGEHSQITCVKYNPRIPKKYVCAYFFGCREPVTSKNL